MISDETKFDTSVRFRWLQAAITLGVIMLAVILILPAVQQSREAERRTQSKNNLKQLGLALYNYHDVHQRFPPGGTFGPQGQGMHGWVMAMMPYIDSSPIYNMVDFQQPWDAPRNAGIYALRIPVFLNPSIRDPIPEKGFGIIHYSANSNLMGANSGVSLSEIDDSHETFIMGELGGDFLPWGCPYNWRPLIGLTNSPRTYGRPENIGCHFLFVDGMVRWVGPDISPAVLAKLQGQDLAAEAAKGLTITRPAAFPFPPDAEEPHWNDWDVDRKTHRRKTNDG